MSFEHIIQLFAPTSEERMILPFIDEYAVKIEAWLEQHEPSQDQLLRYMLAGLFGQYIATNHHGDNFSTVPEDWSSPRRRTTKQLRALNEWLDEPIRSTEEYLALLWSGCSDGVAYHQSGNLFALVVGENAA